MTPVPSLPQPAPLDANPLPLTPPQVSLHGVNVFYGAHHAVHDVSLLIPTGAVTAFIGPSGCGKSTLLRAINRMNDTVPGARLSGQLLLDGEDVYDAAVDVVALRRKVGMVFQKSNPFPQSIFDNVAYGPRIHGTRDKRVLEGIVARSLTRAGLWDEVKDRLHTSALSLSGGQQQRLCIARALAVDPDVLLMDEPTSALDPQATARVEELIRELRGEYTIVIVTHNMQQAARISDQTAFFYAGNLVESGPTEQIFTQPHMPQTADYIAGRFG